LKKYLKLKTGRQGLKKNREMKPKKGVEVGWSKKHTAV